MTKKQIDSTLNVTFKQYFNNEILVVDSVVVAKKRGDDHYLAAVRVHVPAMQDLQTVGFIHTRMTRFIGALGLFFKVHEENVKIEYTQSVDRERSNITFYFKILV
jgi:hypothetical protein